MKRALFILYCTLFCIHIFAQTRVTGRVSDDSGNPLPGAIVTVYNNDNVVSYAIVQSNGEYELEISSDFTNIDFYLLGYKRTSFKVDMKESTSLVKDVKLIEDNSLQEVLNRLPHVKVTTTGQVKVQGVNVNKVYIEDLDLLGARYGLAIQNIRPEGIYLKGFYILHIY